jgi:hypothetical protein
MTVGNLNVYNVFVLRIPSPQYNIKMPTVIVDYIYIKNVNWNET